jgi:tetratricopeptide (TPR) repeat protein
MPFAATVLLSLLTPAIARAADRDELAVSLRKALASDAERKGDRTAAAAEWLAALSCASSSAAVRVILERIAEYEHLDVVPREAAAMYEKLLRIPGALTPRARESLTMRLAARYRTTGWFGREQALLRDLGYVRSWLCIGPFGHTRESVHDIEYAPERGIDLGRARQSGWRNIEWRVLASPDPGPALDLFTPLWPRQGCGYALAQFNAPEESNAYIRVSCAGSHKVWFNALLIGNVDRGRTISETAHVWPIRITRGWNRILVKVTATSARMSCLIFDARGRTPPGLEWEAKATLHKAPPARNAAHDIPATARGELAEYLSRPSLSDVDRARAHAALGMMSQDDGLTHEAVVQLTKAVELAPGQAHLWYQYALALEHDRTMPQSMRRNRARKAFERAAQCDGGFYPADEASAHYLRRDKKPELAIARLRKMAEAYPDNARARMLMAEVALDEGWLHEARDWLQDAEAAAPGNRHVHLLWSRYYEQLRDHARAASALRQAIARDASDTSARQRYAQFLLSGGNARAAIEEMRWVLEANPSDIGGYVSLARMQIDADRTGEALTTVRAALRLAPGRPELHRLLGEVRLRLGDIEEAADAWRAALALRPDWHVLRRQLAEFTGETDDIARPFALDVDKAILESKEPDAFPGADTLLVLDQTVVRLYEDGSYTEITHQAKKALTTSGAEKLSSLETEGELLEARTHIADGTIMEPAVLPGRSTLTMPGVRIGSVIEYRYRRDHPAPAGGFCELPAWYFRGIKTPHQLSDYVVIAPADMKLSITAKNWRRRSPDEQFERFAPRRDGDTVTYRWVARDAHDVQPESGHDHISTFLPHVVVGRARSWQDINAEMLDLFLGRICPTDAIEKEAKEAAGAAKSEKDRARAIFRRVCGLIRSDAPIYDANQILLAKAGKRTVLLTPMLRAAGLEARFAVVRPRAATIDPSSGPGEPNWALPSSRFFTDTLVCVIC